jgi:copper chaperone CopZ
MKTIIKVEGMSCGHCVKHVTNALAELEDASNIVVSLEKATAEFDSNLSIPDEQIKAVLDDAGYEAVKIDHV